MALFRMLAAQVILCSHVSPLASPVKRCWCDPRAHSAAGFAGVHLAVFSWFWSSNPALAVAVGLNWGLGKLSLAKWALLLVLASQGRLWLYFVFEVARLIDRGMAKLFPPVRRFCWAMFTVWALYVALSPTYYYPLPFAPFAPGTLGVQEALA